MASVTIMMEEFQKKVVKEMTGKYTEAINDLDDRLTDKTETVIDTVSGKFKTVDKLVQKNVEAM